MYYLIKILTTAHGLYEKIFVNVSQNQADKFIYEALKLLPRKTDWDDILQLKSFFLLNINEFIDFDPREVISMFYKKKAKSDRSNVYPFTIEDHIEFVDFADLAWGLAVRAGRAKEYRRKGCADPVLRNEIQYQGYDLESDTRPRQVSLLAIYEGISVASERRTDKKQKLSPLPHSEPDPGSSLGEP